MSPSLSFVDIETTGTSPLYNRIIEIGIIRVDDGKISKEYSTLINPEMHIDPFIESLTGISKDDLVDAPIFEDVKSDIFEIIDGSIFVAHNVRFDYGFIRNEFKRCEDMFAQKHFCTVKLGRLLYPGFKNYNLDAIIERHGIICKNRHRALGDAKAICDFYFQSIKELGKEKVAHAVGLAMKRPSVPVGINEKMLDTLPESPGVYLFYTDDHVPLYIGKSIDIRDRVLSHFSGDYLSSSDMKISQQVKEMEYIQTAGELGALFLESELIKKHQPLLNRKLRKYKRLFVVVKTQTEIGYHTVVIEEMEHIDSEILPNVIGIFKTKKQVKDFLMGIAKEKKLCLKLLGLEKTKKECFGKQLNQCLGACIGGEQILKYNLRFDEAFFAHRIKPWPFEGAIIIEEKGDSSEYFIFDRWCFLGSSIQINGIEESIKTAFVFDFDTYKILYRYLSCEANFRKIKKLKPKNSTSEMTALLSRDNGSRSVIAEELRHFQDE